MNTPTKYVPLNAIAEVIGVYREDAAKFLKCCNISNIPAARIPNDACNGQTVKGWEVNAIIALLRRAVTGFTDDQEEYLRSRSRLSWRDIKLGALA